MSNNKTYVIGVGTTKFDKPGTKPGITRGVKVALQHNIGLGGAAVVSIYRKAAH